MTKFCVLYVITHYLSHIDHYESLWFLRHWQRVQSLHHWLVLALQEELHSDTFQPIMKESP